MQLQNTDNIQIQVLIDRETKQGQFNDALYFSLPEYLKLDEKDLETLIEERVNNWLAFVTNPPAPVEPTPEQLEEEKAALETRIADINEQLDN